MIGGWFQSQLWKIMTGCAAVLSIVLGIALTMSYLETRSLTRQNAKYEHSINDPKTGYIATLAQVRTNSATIEHSLTDQNEKLRAKSIADAALLAAATKQVALANEATRNMEWKLKVYMATPPKGNNLEERVSDIDQRFLETLK